MRNTLIRSVLILFSIISTSSFAGQSWLVEINNRTNHEVEVLPVSEQCWYVFDFTYPNTVKIAPGATKRLFSQENNYFFTCYGYYKNLSFQVNGIPFGIESMPFTPSGFVSFPSYSYMRDINGTMKYDHNYFKSLGLVDDTLGPDDLPDDPNTGSYSIGNFLTSGEPLVKIQLNNDGSSQVQKCFLPDEEDQSNIKCAE